MTIQSREDATLGIHIRILAAASSRAARIRTRIRTRRHGPQLV